MSARQPAAAPFLSLRRSPPLWFAYARAYAPLLTAAVLALTACASPAPLSSPRPSAATSATPTHPPAPQPAVPAPPVIPPVATAPAVLPPPPVSSNAAPPS